MRVAEFLKNLDRQTTPGPWVVHGLFDIEGGDEKPIARALWASGTFKQRAEDNCRFIALVRNLWPEIVALVESAEHSIEHPVGGGVIDGGVYYRLNRLTETIAREQSR